MNRDERGHIISIVYIGMYSNQDSSSTIGIIGDNYESQWFWVSKDRKFISIGGNEVIDTLKYDHVSIINDTIARMVDENAEQRAD